MNNDYNENIEIKPELVFEPFQDESPVVKVEEVQKEKIEDIPLTDEEKKMVDQFVEKINLRDSNSILQYGVGAQKKIA
ncbi:MAG: toxic anion resistance protein, partial [Clostridiales bacterium]|nr:toxic anion resistance protein [Clostridiales bacterium]